MHLAILHLVKPASTALVLRAQELRKAILSPFALPKTSLPAPILPAPTLLKTSLPAFTFPAFILPAFILAACIIAAAPHTARAQSELEQLQAALPGTLVNDPTRIDWESYGSAMGPSVVRDDSIPGGKAARRFDVTYAQEHIYTAGANIPLVKRVKRGDQVTIGFYARTIEADSDNGLGVMRVRFQQNMEPYPGFGDKIVNIGKEWDWYEVTARATRVLKARDGIVAMQFGSTKQIIEVGQAIIVTGASSIADNAQTQSSATQSAPAANAPAANLLPAPLAGHGQLLNQPASRNWGMGGTAGRWQPREEGGIWLGQATRFTAEKAGANAADLFATIPIESALKEGDEVLIAIAGRTESASSGDGKAIVGIRIEDRTAPQVHFANNLFKLGPNWQLIRIKTRAPQDFEAGKAQIMLHFAAAPQSLDIGPVYVLKTN